MSNKAPSAGTKVTKGIDRPVYQENPGNVPAESLAAESARKGGAFASNPGHGQGEQAPQKRSQHHQQPEKTGRGTQEGGGTAANKTTSLNLENRQTGRGTTTTTTGEGGGADYGKQVTSLNLENQSAYGGAAPSYITAQRHRDPGGPHGKNLHEESKLEGSGGTAGGEMPEPGSKDDPSRVAERDLKAGMASQGRDAGPRQQKGEGGAGGKTWFSPLGGDEEA